MAIYTVGNGNVVNLLNSSNIEDLDLKSLNWSAIQGMIQMGLIEVDDLDLNSLSWSAIQGMIQEGIFGNYFQAGDTKDITLNLPAGNSASPSDGTLFYYAVSGTYKVVVLGIDHNSELEGTNRVHFCIGQDSTGKEIAFRYKQMNTTNTNVGGWASCPMRTFLNTTLFNNLSSDLTSVISTTTKYTNNTGNASNEEANVTSTSDKIFLLSEFEVFGTRSNANQYEKNKQAQYDYYKNGASKVRYEHNTSYTYGWWLRSAFCYSPADYFCGVDSSGSETIVRADCGNVSYSYGVVPGFTIA